MAPFLAKQIISNGKQKGMTGRREAALHFLGVEARRRERATRSLSTGAVPPVHRQAVLHFPQPRGAGPWRLMSHAVVAASLSSRLRPRPQKSSQPPGPFELSESWSSTFSCASTRSKVVTRDDSRYVLCGGAPMWGHVAFEVLSRRNRTLLVVVPGPEDRGCGSFAWRVAAAGPAPPSFGCESASLPAAGLNLSASCSCDSVSQ